MNENQIKTIAYGAVVITAIGITTATYIKVARQERAKRVEIKKNLILDLEAIARAEEQLSTQIANGKYDGRLDKLIADMDVEFKFQKIAIREDI